MKKNNVGKEGARVPVKCLRLGQKSSHEIELMDLLPLQLSESAIYASCNIGKKSPGLEKTEKKEAESNSSSSPNT